MKRTRRFASLMAVTATVALLATGCSAANPGSDDDSSGAAAATWPEPTASLKGVTLTYWTATQTATMADKVIAAFEQQTGAKINKVIIPDVYETNAPTKLATGAKPDLATWQPTGSELALLKPATGLQNLDGAPWLAKQTDAVQNLGTVDGKHYAAFVNVPSTLGIFYNKQVFADAGITATPKNLDEFLADAKKIKAKGVAPIFGAAGDQWPTQWWPQVLLAEDSKAGLWDKVNKNEDTFEGSAILGAIKTYKSMLDDGLFNQDNATSTYNESGPALLDGKAGMVLQLTSFTSLLQSTADATTINDKIGWFPISKSGNVATSVPGGDNALVAFKTGDSAKEAAARQFLRFWLETDYPTYVKEADAVSLDPAVKTPSTVPQVAVDASDALADAAGSMQQNAVANPDFYVNLANMVNGKATPEQVAKVTQSQFAQIAKALGTSGF
ncbi:extracellular solute-binding protein [Kineosporia mesophila]|uniref:Extracellular solute-binding protein n=1 Tax=Kineosporia mesophila TaxID=566012 RepID=A0ABP6ZGX7_9ACTN|nr:ABC transporter substrate-binding protein [Kineosporia mesophila]MCD5350091.1 ABC transporter substrate-binding protein [Kineosporia mesophila]